MNNFVEWCGRKHLLLNVAKTKKMLVDFRRKMTTTRLRIIMRQKLIKKDGFVLGCGCGKEDTNQTIIHPGQCVTAPPCSTGQTGSLSSTVAKNNTTIHHYVGTLLCIRTY